MYPSSYFPEYYFAGAFFPHGIDPTAFLSMLLLPDYKMEMVTPPSRYQGEVVPVKWWITRLDGSDVSVPDAESVVVVTAPDGTVSGPHPTPYVESSVAVTPMVLVLPHTFDQEGNWKFNPVVSMDAGTEIIEAESTVLVLP